MKLPDSDEFPCSCVTEVHAGGVSMLDRDNFLFGVPLQLKNPIRSANTLISSLILVNSLIFELLL